MATRERIYRIRVLAGNLPFIDICQPGLLGLARLADIRQTILQGLARLKKGKFYVNLASLANLASVG